MKIKLLALCLLATGMAHAKDINNNYTITKQYYSQLISAPATNTAELGLLMNMLPKGADLHHHYSGAIYAETYLEWVGRQKFCIYSEDNAALNAQKFHINTAPTDASSKICLSADATRQNNAFYRELLQKWSDKDFSNHSHEQVAPDQNFFNTFFYFMPVASYAMHEGFQSLKERAQAENVQYLETMVDLAPGISNKEYDDQINQLVQNPANAEAAFTRYADFMAKDATSQQQIRNYIKTMEDAAVGIDSADFKLRIQAYVLRNLSPAQVFTEMYSAFAADQASKLIVAVNIVGPENEHIAMRDYDLHMQMFKFFKKRNPDINLALHAGELALGMVPPEGLKNHINDAVAIAGAQRIGHGIDISHEKNADALLKTLKEKEIAVEVNLTSNEFILGVKNEAHPIQIYRRHGVPFVISSDDPGVSRNNLSGEYLLYASRYKPSYDELKNTAFNSIRYSFLGKAEKQAEMQALKQRFADFETRVAKMAKH